MNARGEQHGRAKLNVWDVTAIRLLFEDPRPPSINRTARAFGVSSRTIRQILTGGLWGWL